MSTAEKVVSKRSGRQYAGSEMEKLVDEQQQEKRASRHGEMADRQSVTTTATTRSSQSSLEPSPMVREADILLEVDTLTLAAHGPHRSAPGLRDAFHPPATNQHLPYSIQEAEKSLPAAGRPVNFGVVVPGVYRSSFPQTEDYAFIEDLKLKTIVTLVRKDFPEGYDEFLHKNDIKHAVFDMKGTKKQDIPLSTMKSILRIVLDRRNHPLLIHCNHGKHRTGCVIGVIRKLSGWNLSNIINEYKSFAEPKARECDINYISGFELANISNLFRDTNLPFRTHNFLRATTFALVMLIIWLVSGHQIAGETVASATKSELMNEDWSED